MPELIFNWRDHLIKEMRRKAIHLSGLSVPLGIVLLGPTITADAIALILAASLLLEAMRLKGLVKLPETREHEKNRVAGYIYYMAGCLFSVFFYSPAVAITSVLFLSLGDTVSGLTGSILKNTDVRGDPGRKERRRVKPLPVLAATFLACLCIAFLGSRLTGLSLGVTAAGAAAAVLADGVAVIAGNWSLDDNFSIPALSGAVMTAAAIML